MVLGIAVVGHTFQREKERELDRERDRECERDRESVIYHQRCELINTYVFLAMWRCTDIHIYIYIYIYNKIGERCPSCVVV